MMTRQDARKDKHFSVWYLTPTGEGTHMMFHTREQCNDFADGMALMGVSQITKSAYNSETRNWESYK